MKNIIKKLFTGLYYLVIGLEIFVLIFSVTSRINNKTPEFLGYSVYVIATPSMENTLKQGNVIICKVYDDSMQINDGDIITYQGKEDSFANKIITHRVVSTRTENNKKYYTTKGDANNSLDPEIGEDQIIAKFVYKTFILSILYSTLTTIGGFVVLVIIPVLYMIAKEIMAMIKEIKEEKANEKTAS